MNKDSSNQEAHSIDPFDFERVRELLDSCTPPQRSLLALLAIGHCKKIDVTRLIDGLAIEQNRVFQFRGRQLSDRMRDGEQAEDIIKSLPGLLSPECVLAMQLAKQNGTLPGFYESVQEQRNTKRGVQNLIADSVWPGLFRLAAKCMLVLFVLTYIALKITPELLMILSEFDIEIPGLFGLFLYLLDMVCRFWFIFLLPVLLMAPFAIGSLRRYFKRFLPTSWRDQTDAPNVVQRKSIALTTKAGRSPKDGTATILNGQFLRKVVKKIRAANKKMNSGREDWSSLASAKVISSKEASALAMSENPETQSWLLQYSANQKKRRRGSQTRFWATTLIVVVNLGLAIFISLTAVSIISVLIKIMEEIQT